MKRYRARYKCRYCGEIFGYSLTGDEGIPISITTSFTCGLHYSQQRCGGNIYDKDIHISEDHIGIGDFVGFEIEEE